MDVRKYISSTERYLSLEGVDAVKNAFLPEKTIMVSCIGSDMGKVAISRKPCVTNQQINSIIVNEDICTEYVYYDLSLRQTEIKSKASGSAVPILNKGHFSNLSIFLPSLPEQKAIAHILGSFDDKIELNRQMNQTLEAMAQAIFKSWFIDFDPVHAKAEGRDPGLPSEIADLFPDSFEESELGMIPKGWKVIEFKEFVAKLNTRVGDLDVPEYSSTNNGLVPRTETFTKRLSKDSSSNKLIRKHDLVFGLSRRLLNFGLMHDIIGSVSPAYNVFSIDTSVIFSDFVETYMRLRMNVYINILGASSREGQSISVSQFLNTGLLVPPSEIQQSYQDYYKTIETAVNQYFQEIQALGSIRDTLLPKLISGELRVPEVETIRRDHINE